MQYRTYSDRAFFFASCDQEGEGGGGGFMESYPL